MGADTMCCAARAGHGPRRSPPRPGRRVCRAPDRSAAGPRVPSALGLRASGFGLPPFSPPPPPIPSARAALRPPAPAALLASAARSRRRPRLRLLAVAPPTDQIARPQRGRARRGARRVLRGGGNLPASPLFPTSAPPPTARLSRRESGNPLRRRGRPRLDETAFLRLQLIECIASAALPGSARGAA